ncbi:MAG: hypothetical protein ACPGSV_06540 [Candidatus Poseidoniaceae archaeon]
MAVIFGLNSSNWIEFFNKKYCYVMFTKSDCEECQILEEHITEASFEKQITLAKLTLDKPGFAQLKQTYPWISRIDTLPFNTVFSEGKLVDSWSGSSFETLQNKLGEISD